MLAKSHAPRRISGGAYSTVGVLFVLLVIAYAGVGRSLIFNRLSTESLDDPIGAYLAYARCMIAMLCIVKVGFAQGNTRIFSNFPAEIVPFSIFVLMSFVWFDEPKSIAREAIQFVLFVWALYCCISYLGRHAVFDVLTRLCAAFCIASVLVAVLVPSVGVHTGAEIIQYNHAGKWKGIFGHKNSLGPWAAFCTVWFSVLIYEKRTRSLFVFISVACGLACLIFSGSTTSMMMTFCMFVTYLALRLHQKTSTMLFVSVLLVSASAVFISAVYLQDAIFDLFGKDSSLTGRTGLWAIAKDHIFDSPLVGQGYGSAGGETFNGLTAQYLGASAMGPESGYLVVLLDTGLVGAAFLFIPILVWIWRGSLTCGQDADGSDSRLLLTTAVGSLVLAYTEATVFSVTSSVGCACITVFILLGYRSNIENKKTTSLNIPEYRRHYSRAVAIQGQRADARV